MAAGDTPEAEPTAAKDAKAIDRLIRVLRTCRVEAACPTRDDLAQKSVIERKGFLVNADEKEDKTFHTDSILSRKSAKPESILNFERETFK
jgi:hypothetical protein